MTTAREPSIYAIVPSNIKLFPLLADYLNNLCEIWLSIAVRDDNIEFINTGD